MRRIIEILSSARAPWFFASVLVFFVSVIAVWYGGLNQDEGWYLYAAQMVQGGKLPYRDFFYTQGPAMPFVYSVLVPVWGMASPLHGLLGGRIVTLMLGMLATLCAVALVRRLVPSERRSFAGFAVFALLAGNLYHAYFTAIPKTYALGSLFLMAGLLLIAHGLECCVMRMSQSIDLANSPQSVSLVNGFISPVALFVGGLSLAFATGTRISLLLILPVVGFTLLFNFKKFRWSFLWYGLGGMLGLFLTYGLFALDPESLKGLLAAQSYHAARGGFDPFFALGSVSRLARGYAALGAVLFAWLALRERVNCHSSFVNCHSSFVNGEQSVNQSTTKPINQLTTKPILWILGLGFAAVFCLQLSAPFPYDDYQVPVMGMLTVLIVAVFSRHVKRDVPAMWFVVLLAGMTSFTSPMLQEWSTFAQDRFWSQKKEMTELAKLREMGKTLNFIDPNGTTLFTQDTYLAIETGRTVPPGMEMGPFCYFPDMDTATAKDVNVLNRELMTELIKSAPCSAAACSGYAFSIAAPSCKETPFDEQMDFFQLLREHYELKDTEPNFGQNATRLLLLTKKKTDKVNGDWSLVNGDLSMVNGQRSLDNGNRSLVNGDLSMVNGQRSDSPMTNDQPPITKSQPPMTNDQPPMTKSQGAVK